MSTNITLKRSSVQGKVPVTTDIALGEIALNTYDGKLFIKKNVDGTESIIDVTANTNLSITSNSSTVSVNSDRGTDVTILAANATTAGVLTADAQTIAGIKTFSANVGIGTTTPATNLDIVGSAAVTRGISMGTVGVADTAYLSQYRSTVETIWGPLTTRALLGTQSNHDIAIQTNAIEKMRISTNGNIGIGNTTPVDKLSVNGSVTATSFNSTSGFIENTQTIASNYTLVATRNAMSTGPITINSGVTVTIETGARWMVI